MKTLFIIENSFNFKEGDLIKSYKKVPNGIITEKNDFITNKSFVVLQEKLSSDDEKRIKEIINQALHKLLWNLYTKQAILVN